MIQNILLITSDLKLSELSSATIWESVETDALEKILQGFEVQQICTHQNRLERKRIRSGIPRIKSFDTFEREPSRYPNMDPALIDVIKTLQFIAERNDVIVIGGNGVGKTHIAQATGYEALKHGYRVKYRTSQLIKTEITDARSEKRLLAYCKTMAAPDLLIIDEFGRVEFENEIAQVLFDIIDARYESKSTFYLTNHDFEEWAQFLASTDLALAFAGRVVHHSIVLNMIDGIDYRLEHALNNQREQGQDTEDGPDEEDTV